MKKEQNGRESLRRLKLTVGCNASKRRSPSVVDEVAEGALVFQFSLFCIIPLVLNSVHHPDVALT